MQFSASQSNEWKSTATLHLPPYFSASLLLFCLIAIVHSMNDNEDYLPSFDRCYQHCCKFSPWGIFSTFYALVTFNVIYCCCFVLVIFAGSWLLWRIHLSSSNFFYCSFFKKIPITSSNCFRCSFFDTSFFPVLTSFIVIALTNLSLQFRFLLLFFLWIIPLSSFNCFRQTDTRWWLLPLVSIKMTKMVNLIMLTMIWDAKVDDKVSMQSRQFSLFFSEEMLQPWTMRPDLFPRWLHHHFTQFSSIFSIH